MFKTGWQTLLVAWMAVAPSVATLASGPAAGWLKAAGCQCGPGSCQLGECGGGRCVSGLAVGSCCHSSSRQTLQLDKTLQLDIDSPPPKLRSGGCCASQAAGDLSLTSLEADASQVAFIPLRLSILEISDILEISAWPRPPAVRFGAEVPLSGPGFCRCGCAAAPIGPIAPLDSRPLHDQQVLLRELFSSQLEFLEPPQLGDRDWDGLSHLAHESASQRQARLSRWQN